MRPKIIDFLKQEPTSPSNLQQSKQFVIELFALAERTEQTLKAAASKPRSGQSKAAAAAAGVVNT